MVLQHTGIALHTVQLGLTTAHHSVQLGLTVLRWEVPVGWPQTDGSTWSFRARCGGKRAQRIVTHATKPALRTRHLPLNPPAAIHSRAPPPTPLNSMPTRLEGGGEVREALHRSVFVWTDWLTAASVLSGLTSSRPYQPCLD